MAPCRFLGRLPDPIQVAPNASFTILVSGVLFKETDGEIA